jgi:hypothetical protein
MAEDLAGRLDAIRIARDDREHTLGLLGRLAADAFTTPGLGGGEWSPKDLVGHLESWERHALDALDAWDRGDAAPIGDLLQTVGTDEVNRREFQRKASMTAEDVRSSAAATHGRMLERFEGLTDDRWGSPPSPGDEHTVGGRLGSILGGKLGGFRHDPDHWADLEAFVAAHPG